MANPGPDGKVIAEKARNAKFDESKAVSGDVKGGKVKVVPVDERHQDIKEVEAGAVVAQMDTTAPGDETPLPPGKFHVYLHKEGGQWKAHAEADGKVVASAARVTVEQLEKGKKPPHTSRISSEGWCWWWYWDCGWFGLWIIICW
jgi:hypothetical protein